MSEPARKPAARVLTRSDAETLALGGRLAATYEPDRHGALRLYLSGELGAGKTTLTRGFLRALGVSQAVRSPTYALLEEYATTKGMILHADFYRLSGAADLESLGLADYDRPGALWIVEWPEQASPGLPPADIALHWRTHSDIREVHIEACTEAGEGWARRLEAALR